MTVALREAHARDIEPIARLHAESWRVAYRGAYSDEYLDGDVFRDRASVWQDRLSAPAANQFTIVAEDAGAIVGFACAYGGDDARWGTLLDNIHVDPLRTRSGVGTLLIARVAEWTRDQYPASGLYLWVLEVNARARSFYERLGARNEERTTSVPPGGGSIIALRYVWPDPEAIVLHAKDVS